MNTDRSPRIATRLLAVLPIAAVAFSLAACSAPERPSAKEVAAGYHKIVEEAGQTAMYPGDMIECLAEAMVKSEISDQDLANIADGKDLQTSKDSQKLLVKVVSEAAPGCQPQQ